MCYIHEVPVLDNYAMSMPMSDSSVPMATVDPNEAIIQVIVTGMGKI